MICPECKEEKEIYAKGLCYKCYNRKYYEDFAKPRVEQAKDYMNMPIEKAIFLDEEEDEELVN